MSKHLIVVAAALGVVACGQAAQPQQSAPASQTPQSSASPAQQAAQGAQQVGQGAQQAARGAEQAGQQFARGLAQMAQGIQQGLGQRGADGKPVPPVDFEKLEALLPAPDGWIKGKSSGRQISTIVSTSNAEVSYTKGPMNVHVEITDSAMSQILLAPLSFMLAAGYSERSSSGYEKSMTIAGSPGFEKWTNDDKRGEVTVVVNNRFIIAGKGSNLDSMDTLRGFVTQVDVGKLAALK